ncbi:glutamate receptor ionotropic, kainate 2-like isoform X2 [Adelges cooleyi]|uniref:glutamate receptor ionotropic, kainate 2-like isoform X2 n=1 Tax=Adelges cooleyi TaxID=133065 RepID=UPI00217F375B|nr:glutamate receptor ionotropic, kainate 2-like isoform X2 [Adelges cooleyi]
MFFVVVLHVGKYIYKQSKLYTNYRIKKSRIFIMIQWHRGITTKLIFMVVLQDWVHAMDKIKIGALFTYDQINGSAEVAFKFSVNQINHDVNLLPHTQVSYDIQYVPNDNSFYATKKACNQLNLGITTLFGPSNGYLASHVHSMCDALDLPHMEARLDLDNEPKRLSVNLYPAQNLLNQAYNDVISFLNWTKMAIIYEHDYDLFRMKDFMKSVPNKKPVDVYLRYATPETYRSVLSEIKNMEIYNMLVDTKSEHVNHFLRGILQLQMNDYKFHYLFTSFDMGMFDLEDFKYNFVNLTAFRMVDVDDVGVREILKQMKTYAVENNHTVDKFMLTQCEPALVYDSVQVMAVGLSALQHNNKLEYANISCKEEIPWKSGSSLINYINSVEVKGLTGPIQFKEGRRTDFKLDLMKLKQHSLSKVGEWTPGIGINITDMSAFHDTAPYNITLVVVTIEQFPYVMMHRTKNYTGNARFYGFCVDLLEMIAKQVGFDYILDLVPDNKYGAQDPVTLEWNGIVEQLIKHKADLAVGSMTINYARESVIDFTKPFMNLGISILYKVPSNQPAQFFSFMNPLAMEVWIYWLVAYIVVSFTLYIVARFSPYEWDDPNSGGVWNNSNSDFSPSNSNRFSLSNSFWFTIGSLMQQGSDIYPKAISTKIVGCVWWSFTLIIVSSYTANLAAFLTVERMVSPIENAEDLAAQTNIAYGTLDSGTTMTFFRDSMIETYKKMWAYMRKKKPSVFVTSYNEGIERVLQGNYAFLMESTMLDYAVQRNCNLTQINGLLDSKGYGIATPMGSPWKDQISLTILDLQEKGEIQMLYNKWWKPPNDNMCVPEESNGGSKTNTLDFKNICGVFVVLLVGLFISIFVAFYEFYYYRKKMKYTEQRIGPHRSMWRDLLDELWFVLKCKGSRQRTVLTHRCEQCHPTTIERRSRRDFMEANIL